ncbi:MAG TPA: hypothetical protein VFG25_00550, partial [Nitrosopumilaceae archaeon]|nr:hypothetical protein [Nitrosopumilaceae archaeon]
MKWGIGLLSTLIAVLILFAIPDASAFTSTKIIPPDIAPGDNYGNAVFISGDYAIVGSPLDDDACLPAVDSICDSGAAYIFERDASGVWNFVQKLVASDAAKFVEFGSDVFISGNFAFVGSIGDEHDVTGGPNAGSVYVFERNAEGEWIEIQKIQTSDGSSHAFFGYSIFVSENTMVVGLPLSNAHSLDSGTAYIFERNAEGEWIEINEIFPTDIAERDEFGRGVSVFGSTAIIGSPNDDDDGSNSGSAYIFERDANGNWGQTAKLTASNAAAGDLFGISTFILDNSAFVGAITKEEIPHPVLGTLLLPFGSVYVFEKNAEGEWIETEILLPPDLVCCHNMGVDISVSGNLLIAGDTFESVAHVFEKDDSGTWSQIEKVSGSDTLDDDSFGFSVSISGENAIVGAPFHSIDGEDPGFFEESGGAWIFDFRPQIADVSISKTTDSTSVSPGEEFLYDMIITNSATSNIDARGVFVIDSLSGPGTFVSVSPNTECFIDGPQQVRCEFDTIAIGESKLVSVLVRVNDLPDVNNGDEFSNSVEVTTSTDDPNIDDNSALVNGPTVGTTADVSISKTTDSTSV